MTLPIGEPVRILKHRYAGWTARIVSHDEVTGYYWVRLLADQQGLEALTTHTDGPYTRNELEPLKTGSEARATQPYVGARMPRFSEGRRDG